MLGKVSVQPSVGHWKVLPAKKETGLSQCCAVLCPWVGILAQSSSLSVLCPHTPPRLHEHYLCTTGHPHLAIPLPSRDCVGL